DETEIQDITLVKNAGSSSGTIAYGESKDLEIPAGEIRELVFSCEKAGFYSLKYNSSTGSYPHCVIFSESGKFKGGFNSRFFAAAGEKFIIRISTYSSTVLSGIALTDEHYDGDGDGKCDVCGIEFSASIALGEKKDVTVPEGELREFVFKCEKDGKYWLQADSLSGASSYSAGLYDSEGTYLAYFGETKELKAGENYLLRFKSNSGVLSIKGISVGHNHIDSDGDDKCEICSKVYKITLTLGVPVDVRLSDGEERELYFTCGHDGEYKFSYYSSTGNWDDESIYDSDGNFVVYW
ncbi:MAG: hypothetical protein IKS39_08520, partial [Clostridia bacterium]|nr:hypothetical protein [Clostridia bacterium]